MAVIFYIGIYLVIEIKSSISLYSNPSKNK